MIRSVPTLNLKICLDGHFDKLHVAVVSVLAHPRTPWRRVVILVVPKPTIGFNFRKLFSKTKLAFFYLSRVAYLVSLIYKISIKSCTLLTCM